MGHRLFLAGCVLLGFGGILLIAYAASLIPTTDSRSDAPSPLPNDICRDLAEEAAPSQSHQTGSADSDYTVFYSGDLAALANQTYSPEDIGSPDPQGVFRILLIPVGYNDDADLDAHFIPIIEEAEAVWADLGLDVRYAYLRRPLPIPIYEFNDSLRAYDPSIGDAHLSQTWSQISQGSLYSFHVMSLYVNTPINLSSTAYINGPYQAMVGESSRSRTSLIHETGHSLSLDDGYFRHYDYTDITSGRNSELFLSVDDLPRERQRLLTETSTAIVTTPYVCNDRPVFAPAGSPESIMNIYFDQTDLWIDGHLNPAVFTPYQIALMDLHLDGILAQAP